MDYAPYMMYVIYSNLLIIGSTSHRIKQLTHETTFFSSKVSKRHLARKTTMIRTDGQITQP